MEEDRLRAILVTEFAKDMSLEQINKIPNKYVHRVDSVIDKAVELFMKLQDDTRRS